MKEVASIFVNFVNHFAAHKSTLGVLNRASIFVNHQNLHTTHSRKLKCCQTRDLIYGLNLRCVCVCRPDVVYWYSFEMLYSFGNPRGRV